MLVSKNARNLRFPQCEFLNLHHLTQNPNASQWNIGWVPNAKFLRWACTIHVVCVNFICVG